MKFHALLWQIINSQELVGTLQCSHPQNILQKLKVPFSFHQQTAGFARFDFACQSQRPLSPTGVRSYTIRDDRENFFLVVFCWVRGNLETLCNGAAKVLKACESVLPSKRLRVGLLEKRSPCCIHTEWRATSSLLWVFFLFSNLGLNPSADFQPNKV